MRGPARDVPHRVLGARAPPRHRTANHAGRGDSELVERSQVRVFAEITKPNRRQRRASVPRLEIDIRQGTVEKPDKTVNNGAAG
jgi:hypothetical protein